MKDLEATMFAILSKFVVNAKILQNNVSSELPLIVNYKNGQIIGFGSTVLGGKPWIGENKVVRFTQDEKKMCFGGIIYCFASTHISSGNMEREKLFCKCTTT